MAFIGTDILEELVLEESGVYGIVFEGEVVYVGSTSNFRNRWYNHRYAFRRGLHYNPYLSYLASQFGDSRFSFKVLEAMPPDRYRLLSREDHWIGKLKPKANKDIKFFSRR